MIEVTELTRQFGNVTAVDRLSFTVSAGEVLGFLGPNGAGKTTTMRIVTGFLAPSAGTVTVFGNDVRTASKAVRARIGYLPEGAPLYGDMTPVQLLRFATRMHGLTVQRTRERIAFAIERLALKEVVSLRCETLSKGFRRRVALALAIVHDPDVLILDEPTDGLDPNQKHDVRGLIRDLSMDRIIVVSTHVLEEVDAVCSRAIIIGNGRLLADGTPLQLAARSRFHGAVTLTFRDLPADVEVLNEIGSGTHIESGVAPRITVFPRQQARADGKSLFDVTRQLAAERRWSLDGLFVEQGRLEEVFRTLTTAAANPSAATPSAATPSAAAPSSAAANATGTAAL